MQAFGIRIVGTDHVVASPWDDRIEFPTEAAAQCFISAIALDRSEIGANGEPAHRYVRLRGLWGVLLAAHTGLPPMLASERAALSAALCAEFEAVKNDPARLGTAADSVWLDAVVQ